MGEPIRQHIFWLTAKGQRVVSLSEHAAPFTEIEVSKGSSDPWYRLAALVDTGSTETMAALQLLIGMKLSHTSMVEMTGNWSRTHVQFYRAECRFPAFPQMTIGCNIGELGLDAEQQHVKALIGIDVLRYCTLVLRAPPADSYLEFDPEELRRQAQLARR